jgi:hypothetical protein
VKNKKDAVSITNANEKPLIIDIPIYLFEIFKIFKKPKNQFLWLFTFKK